MYSKGGDYPKPPNPLAYPMLFCANAVPFFILIPHPKWVVCLISNSMSSLPGCCQVGENDERVDAQSSGQQFVGPYRHQCHVTSQTE